MLLLMLLLLCTRVVVVVGGGGVFVKFVFNILAHIFERKFSGSCVQIGRFVATWVTFWTTFFVEALRHWKHWATQLLSYIKSQKHQRICQLLGHFCKN